MTTKLLDTTFLIHYWAGQDAVEKYLDEHEESAEFVTTTVNLKEIAVGRELQGSLDPATIQDTFDWVRIVPFRLDHAFVAGRLEARLHDGGDVNQDRINALAGDLLIGAVAAEQDATVVTRNTADFEFLGIDAEEY